MYSARSFYKSPATLDPASSSYKPNTGYALKDLNDDGTNELIFLCDYEVMAIFSVHEGAPCLLRHYENIDSTWKLQSAWIDENGYVHEVKNKTGIRFAHEVYQVAPDGATLALIEEFGTRSEDTIACVFDTLYYKLENGKTTEITQSAYQVLEHLYGAYVDLQTNAENTKTSLQNHFTPLFSQQQLAMEIFEAVLSNQKMIWNSSQNGSHYLMNYILPDSNQHLYDYRDLKHVYWDMNGDSVSELVIECETFLVLEYTNGKVTIRPFTDEETQRLQAEKANELIPLNVSWNQLLTKEETIARAGEIWGYVNGEIIYGHTKPNLACIMRFEIEDEVQIGSNIYYKVVSYIDNYELPLHENAIPYYISKNESMYIDRSTGKISYLPITEEGK